MALIGTQGPSLMLSPRTAFLLEKACRVSDLRVRMRGRDPQVSEELLELRRLAMWFEANRPALPVLPEVEADSAEVGPPSQVWFSSGQAADLLDITDRAVRLACQQGTLDAERVGRSWRITKQAIDDYRATRGASK